VNIRQENEESLRAFMERFIRVALSIQNLSPEVTMHHMFTTLRPWAFTDSLCKWPTTNLDGLRQTIAKFMQLEELRSFKSQIRMEEGVKRMEKDAGRWKKQKDVYKGTRFARYSPLNINQAKILEETLYTELIPLPRKIPTPSNVDHNKHCRYHKNFDHNTEVCAGLRDKIEELIQAGHVKQYVQRNEAKIFNYREGGME